MTVVLWDNEQIKDCATPASPALLGVDELEQEYVACAQQQEELRVAHALGIWEPGAEKNCGY